MIWVQRLKTIGIVLLSLVTAGLMVAAWWHVRPNQTVSAMPGTTIASQAATPAAGHTATPSATTTPSPTQAVARAVFMGDSYAAGTGGNGVRWTALVAKQLGWKEVNLGRAGTGYLTSVTDATAKSTCGKAECLSFPKMVPEVVAQEPDVVVVVSSTNTTSDLSAVSLAMFGELRKQLPEARIIVLSPLWRASAYPSSLVTLGKTLKKNAELAGVDYVAVGSPLEGHLEWIAADGVNPNAEGQKALAEAISAKLD